MSSIPEKFYLLKVETESLEKDEIETLEKGGEICSELTIRTPERCLFI